LLNTAKAKAFSASSSEFALVLNGIMLLIEMLLCSPVNGLNY
ncbi:hypothetical protein PROVRETT_09108, partial [Providencia rettgeri DSM 1131]